MSQRGRKKGCTDIEAHMLRARLYDAYDNLVREERTENAMRAEYLTRGYYIEKLFAMHIAPWSKSRIRRLLIYRYKDERK